METPPRWETLGRRLEFEGRVFEVWRERVRLGGRETHYDVVRHPGAVAVVALHDDGAVALLRQFRYAVGEDVWEIPAGTLEEGESFERCAERELAEEIGARAERWTALATFYTTPGFCDEVMRVYLAEGLSEAKGELDPDEHLEVVRVPLPQALAWAVGGRIRDAKTLVGLFLTRARLAAEGRGPAGVA